VSASVFVHLDNPIDDSELPEIHQFLETVIHDKPVADWVLKSEKELATLKRYSSIHCSAAEQDLSCELHRYPILRQINFEGVPILILEKELKKHIPIRTGQIVNTDDPAFNEGLKRSELAIKTYLEREGFFNATIRTTLVPVQGYPASDVLFKVETGSFLRVKDVFLKNDLPGISEMATKPFRRMCSSIRYAFEGILQGTKACYNRDVEREKTAEVEDALSSLGYVEAHVAVERHIVDEPGQPRHLNLIVNVLLGPKLSVEFSGPLLEAQILDASPFVRSLRYLSGVEFFSRLFKLPAAHALYPEDETILINQLRDALTFHESHIIDDGQIQASADALREVLRSRGYANAIIESSGPTKAENENAFKVVFKITPGEPTSLSSIELVGSKLFSYEDIRSKVDMQGGIRTAFFSGHYTNASIENDTLQMTRFFHKQGFAKATTRAILEQGDEGTHLIYVVDEGPRRLVKNIVFNNDDEKLTHEYINAYPGCPNHRIERSENQTRVICDLYPFVESEMENESITLSSLYARNGYLKTNPTYRFEEKDGEVDIFFDFKPSEMTRAKVAQLLIDGNIETYSSVIERELGKSNIKPGVNFVPFKLEDALRRLRSYNVFSRVSLEPLAKLDSADEYFLSLQVVEKPTLSLDMIARFDSDTLFSLGLALEEKNLFGTLLDLSTSLQFGFFFGRESKFANILTWPRFFGSPMNVKLKGPELLYEQVVKNGPTGINERHAQLKSALEFDWLFINLLRPSIEFQLRIDAWQFETFPPFSNQNFFHDAWASITSLDGLLDVLKEPASIRAVLKPSLSVTKLDNLFDPRLGFNVKGGLEISSLTTDLPYAVFDFRGMGYVPIGPFTLASKLEIRRGLISDPETNWWVLQEEADFKLLGGLEGPRAYAQDTLGIYGVIRNKQGPILLNSNPVVALHPGDFSMFASTELRFPLIEKFFLGKLNGAVFTDLGYVGICNDDFFCLSKDQTQPEPNFSNPYQLGWSVGVGLRLVTPVGPLLLDYGISPIHVGSGPFGRQSNVVFQFGYLY